MTKTKNIQNTAKELYMDYSATTPTRQAVLDEALPFFVEKYGNPSSFHSTGLVAKRTLQDARERVAKILNCDEKEIVFNCIRYLPGCYCIFFNLCSKV